MGGKAFPKQAKRLSTKELDKLTEHCLEAVKPFFEKVKPLRHAKDKVEHGDLDLVCAWSNEKALQWKGDGVETGTILASEGVNRFNFEWQILPATVTIPEAIDANPTVTKEDTSDAGLLEGTSHDTLKYAAQMVSEPEQEIAWVDAPEDLNEIRRLKLRQKCFEICRTVGAYDWVKKGQVISYAVPCKVVDPEMDDTMVFYQLDLILTHPQSFDIQLFQDSYSHISMLLGQSIRNISQHLTLQNTGFILRHDLYPTLPKIDVLLTTSTSEMREYLGLKYDEWLKVSDENGGGFETEKASWRWLVNVEKGSNLDIAYTKMVLKEIRPKEGDKKHNVFVEFVEFLRTETRYKEVYDKQQEKGFTRGFKTFKKRFDILDPDVTNDISWKALEALDYFGKREEYLKLKKEKRREVIALCNAKKEQQAETLKQMARGIQETKKSEVRLEA